MAPACCRPERQSGRRCCSCRWRRACRARARRARSTRSTTSCLRSSGNVCTASAASSMARNSSARAVLATAQLRHLHRQAREHRQLDRPVDHQRALALVLHPVDRQALEAVGVEGGDEQAAATNGNEQTRAPSGHGGTRRIHLRKDPFDKASNLVPAPPTMRTVMNRFDVSRPGQRHRRRGRWRSALAAAGLVGALDRARPAAGRMRGPDVRSLCARTRRRSALLESAQGLGRCPTDAATAVYDMRVEGDGAARPRILGLAAAAWASWPGSSMRRRSKHELAAALRYAAACERRSRRGAGRTRGHRARARPRRPRRAAACASSATITARRAIAARLVTDASRTTAWRGSGSLARCAGAAAVRPAAAAALVRAGVVAARTRGRSAAGARRRRFRATTLMRGHRRRGRQLRLASERAAWPLALARAERCAARAGCCWAMRRTWCIRWPARG